MEKIEIEIPDFVVVKETAKIRQQFLEKIAKPFNKAFQDFKTQDDCYEHLCFELCIDDLEPNEVGWGRFYSLPAGPEDEPTCFAQFYLNGKAHFDIPGFQSENGTWEEIFKLILNFIKKEMSQFEETHAAINRIESAIQNLQ